MNLQTQIDEIKKEVGKPRKDRGEKVKQAAIDFEEHFREKIIESKDFDLWMKGESELARYHNDPSGARKALQQAGTRTDLPRPFEIVRMGKSTWMLQPPESYFLQGRYPKEMVVFLQKTTRRVKALLQSVNWDVQTPMQKLSLATQYRYYKNGLEHMLLTMTDMQLALDNMNEEFLGLSTTPQALGDGTEQGI